MAIENPAMVRLLLPYAPSVNVIWRRGRNCTYKTKAAVEYGERVLAERSRLFPDSEIVFSGWVTVDMTLHPKRPKKTAVDWAVENCRRQDVDACVKVVLDSLQHARVFEDDRQVVMQRSCIGEAVSGGGITVVVRAADKWFEHLESPSDSAAFPVKGLANGG